MIFNDQTKTKIHLPTLLITCVDWMLKSLRLKSINIRKSLEEPREFETVTISTMERGLTLATFQSQLRRFSLHLLLHHRRLLFSNNISFVSKLLLLIEFESVYSNFYVITFQYFHLYISSSLFTLVKRDLCIKFPFKCGVKSNAGFFLQISSFYSYSGSTIDIFISLHHYT